MNYYDDLERWQEKGVDWDLIACLENNPQDSFGIPNIDKVLAVREGRNDEETWIWLIKLDGGRYAFLEGWCDYTGWDCQSGAVSFVGIDPLTALEKGMHIAKDKWNTGPNHMNDYQNIVCQIIAGDKARTWREKMDKEFGLTGE